jgi:hypothetical protein
LGDRSIKEEESSNNNTLEKSTVFDPEKVVLIPVVAES